MKKDLQNNPIIFWLLAAIAVGSFIFAIYTFQITKPSRELSYRVYSKALGLPADLPEKFFVSTPMGNFSIGEGYIKELDIWNSGNLEIEESYVLKSIKLSFSEDDRIVDYQGINMQDGDIKFDISNRILNLSVHKILAKAGIKVRYYAKSSSSIPTIEGLISDPIRGAIPVKQGSLLGFTMQEVKIEKWYVGLIAILFLPITFSSLIWQISVIETNTRRGSFVKGLVMYPITLGVISYIVLQFYDIYIGAPPF